MSDTNPVMSGSPGGEPVSNPQQPQQPQGAFGKIGAFLKQVMPYVTPVANRLAAAAGNYGPIELEHQQREQQMEQSRLTLAQQLQQSTLQNQDLQRQVTQHQLALSTPGSPEYTASQEASVKHAGDIADVNALHAPSHDTIVANESGQPGYVTSEYDKATNTRVTHPKMITSQVPNPDRQAYADVVAGGAPPNLVQDWNAGPPPTMPATVPKQTQAFAPNTVGFHTTGFDANGNPVVSEYSKYGGPMGNQTAPTPVGAMPHTELSARDAITQTPTGPIVNTLHSSKTTTVGGAGTPPQGPMPAPSPKSASGGTNPRALLGPNGQPVAPKASSVVTGAFNTLNQSQERLAVMQNALKAASGGDQQAMLNLLANHLGMTMGLQKGARLNQALIEEAQKSTPWLQGMAAKFDDRGYLSGVTLTPQQMQSMVQLAQDRVSEDQNAYSRAQKAAGSNFAPDAGGASDSSGGSFAKWNASRNSQAPPQ